MMVVTELFSERMKRERGEAQDVFQYDEIPPRLRQQVAFIIEDAFGDFDNGYQQAPYKLLVETLRREFGLAELVDSYNLEFGEELEHFILQSRNNVAVLDAIELCLRLIYHNIEGRDQINDDHFNSLLDEFNHRCRQSSLGFSFERGTLIRVDSHYLHAEAVKPALLLLSSPEFENASREFRKAHEHWRSERYAEVLVDCLKAFESVIKIIAAERGWEIPERATASQLVAILIDHNFIPAYYQTHFAGLRSMLESGIPTPRNRVGGHGAGPGDAQPVPPSLVRYVLHQTAATIAFLVDTHKGT